MDSKNTTLDGNLTVTRFAWNIYQWRIYEQRNIRERTIVDSSVENTRVVEYEGTWKSMPVNDARSEGVLGHCGRERLLRRFGWEVETVLFAKYKGVRVRSGGFKDESDAETGRLIRDVDDRGLGTNSKSNPR